MTSKKRPCGANNKDPLACDNGNRNMTHVVAVVLVVAAVAQTTLFLSILCFFLFYAICFPLSIFFYVQVMERYKTTMIALVIKRASPLASTSIILFHCVGIF
jgi:hypothetical protein